MIYFYIILLVMIKMLHVAVTMGEVAVGKRGQRITEWVRDK